MCLPIPDGADASANVLQVPPPPSSGSLLLSALASVGAVHLARSARHLHLTKLPHWYHSGCPGQIGHAVALDMQFAPVAICRADRPIEPEPPAVHRLYRERRSRIIPQTILLPQAPRGPPAVTR